MSGICGVLDRAGGAVDPGSLDAMNACFGKWFKDDYGRCCDGGMGLGHVMLWNTPESRHESLPAWDGPIGRRLAITADVRLDNRAELAEMLGISTPLESITDSQLLLAAYRKWREQSPKHLLGDFAYAIWDEERRELFCARDHVGIKQFYYSLADEKFVFANDVAALLASGLVPNGLNEEAIAIYLRSSEYIDPRKTFYKSVHKLEAASTLLVSDSDITRDTYWSVEQSPPVRFDDFDGYVHHLRQLLEDAVKVRLRTAYPVTSHLSGGLDSSAITVLAARLLSKRGELPRVFNWSYHPEAEDDPDCMEWSLANKVAEQESLRLEHISITPEAVKESFLGADISLYEDNLYWEEASERALTVEQGGRTILSGWGGDELVSYGGYSYYSSLIRRGKFLRVFLSIYRNSRRKNRSLYRIAKRYVWYVLYGFFNETMAGLYKADKNDDVLAVVTSDFKPVVSAASPPGLKFQTGPHGEQKELFGNGHILSRIELWGAAALRDGVEYCYPLLDRRVVEFALGVPEEVFELRNGEARYLFRSVIADFLPQEVAWAPKYDVTRYDDFRKRLYLDVLELLLQEDTGLFGRSNKYVDTQALRLILEQIVGCDRADASNHQYFGAVGTAVAVTVLNTPGKSADSTVI